MFTNKQVRTYLGLQEAQRGKFYGNVKFDPKRLNNEQLELEQQVAG
jgi:hypothetical protein